MFDKKKRPEASVANYFKKYVSNFRSPSSASISLTCPAICAVTTGS